MAVTDHHETATKPEVPVRPVSSCPSCGTLVSGVRYCPECGHAIALPTSSMPSTAVQQPQTTVDQATADELTVEQPQVILPAGVAPAGERRRRRVIGLALGVALVLVATVAAVIILTNNSSTTSPGATYQQSLTSALAPVIAANRTLSSALQAIDGTQPTVTAAKNATTQAQNAVVGARAAVGVLRVPSSQTTLSQQVQQALTEEAGYLQAVSGTLSDPAGQSASQVRTLAVSTQSALVPLAPVAGGAAAGIGGSDNLLSWAGGASGQAQSNSAAAQRQAIQKAASQGQTTVIVPQATTPPGSSPPATSYVTPAGAAVPGSWSTTQANVASASGTPYQWGGGQQCDQNIFAGDNTSCGFADNVFEVVAAADHYDSVIPASITADSPAAGATYSLTCTEYWGNDNQYDVQCINSSGGGAAFPVQAADAYYQ